MQLFNSVVIWIRQYEYKHLHCESVVTMHHIQTIMINNNGKRVLFSPVPNLGAAVLEELEEFWYHNVEGSVQSVAVQQLRRVLADFLQRSK